MAQKRKYVVGAINITVHPHPSSDIYIQLLKDAWDLRRAMSSRGDHRLLLQSVGTEDDRGVVDGLIARFTHIDLDSPWFNFETYDEAEDNDVRRVQIPPQLRPNYKGFRYRLFSSNHILTFESYHGENRVSPGVICLFFKRLFNAPELQERYGEVNVSVITDEEALNEIFSISHLTHLEMEISRPNPDELGGLDESIQDRLTRQHMSKAHVKYTAIRGQSIEPDEKTKSVARVAMNNGYVSGAGKNEDGVSVEKSTKDHPKIRQMQYDPDVTSATSVFNTLSQLFVN